MRLLFSLLCVLVVPPLVPTALSQADTLVGPWDGAISIGAVTLDITVTFSEGGSATIDIPQQGAM
ncbi:MAG: alpha/beta hydrolase, partial [Bacteroidota bacterium]